ncbi:hypothetical protein GCM10009835_43250 [Planosporangium flavigriseum]|uniref:Uncharacterized protein n=1 Tax=Planosporangium flavigriseum TaxID=373681 RepID=A0A8J3LQC7_9ACTN|nr:hypothetical protein Pfl04_31170 [Planosporangium flavigriseum]
MPSMKACHFAPVAPLHVQPVGPYATPGDCADVLADALRGVALGGYDELICVWLVQRLDLSTLRVLVSLLERVRQAGNREAAATVLPDRHPQPPNRHADGGAAPLPRRNDRHGRYDGPGFTAGNSGPGFS